MKSIFSNIYLSIVLWLCLMISSSCYTVYQVLETKLSDTKIDQNTYVFENTDAKISYDFWSNGGKICFIITNKLDRPIYLDLNKSHFIYNGYSYEYWNDAEDEKFLSYQIFSPYNNLTSSLKLKYKPKKIIHIPENSSISIATPFYIIAKPYTSCNFSVYKAYKDSTSRFFTKESSPINFRNYLTYSTVESFEQHKIINNEFYVSSISNISENQFIKKVKSYNKNCGLSFETTYETTYPFRKNNSCYMEIVLK